jgi:hypothetical protein
MADPAFWRELAATFLQIPGHDMIRADGQYTVGSREAWTWRLAGSLNDFIRNTFESLATRGAFEIAPIGTTDLVNAWLEAIREEHINFRSDLTSPEFLFGTIYGVCEASATLCRILEKRAIQAEFKEKQRHDPKNWSPLRQRFEAFKAIKKLQAGPHEQIPEALVRDSIGDQLGIKPEEVTGKQIQVAVAGLLRDYPAITLIPSPRNAETEIAPGPASDTTEPGENPIAESPADREKEIERRQRLLADYKAATGDPPDYRIYNAKNSGIHKPEFYEWKKGTLSRRTKTAQNFERFLREKKPPIPRKPPA